MTRVLWFSLVVVLGLAVAGWTAASASPASPPERLPRRSPVSRAVRTPTATLTSTSTPTDTVTRTPTPSATATASNTPTLTDTATSTPTETPTSTTTTTATPSLTDTPTTTMTSTNTVTPTATPNACAVASISLAPTLPVGFANPGATLPPNKPAGATEFPQLQPGGTWTILSLEMASHPAYSGTDAQFEQNNGYWMDLWAASAAGQWTNLTNYGSAFPAGVLTPKFSRDGKQIAWAKWVGWPNGPGDLGSWQLWVADFTVDANGVPSLTNARNISPASGVWYEVEDWAPDNRTLLVSSDWQSSYDYAPNDFAVDTVGGAFTNLTNSPNQWNEQGRFSPSGAKVIHMSSAPLPALLPQDARVDYGTYVTNDLATEFWLMNADGSNPVQVSGFNVAAPAGVPDPERLKSGHVVVFGTEWSADGTEAILHEGQAMWLLRFAGACG